MYEIYIAEDKQTLGIISIDQTETKTLQLLNTITLTEARISLDDKADFIGLSRDMKQAASLNE